MAKKQTDGPAEEKADDEKPDSSSTISDVSKPGSTPASPTSRPIIVGHQSGLKQDPLLAKDEFGEPTKEPAQSPHLTKQKKIIPLSAPENPEELKPKKIDEKPADEKPLNPDSSGAIDALAGEVSAKAQAKEQSKAEQDQQEKVKEMIDSRKYHLPITEGGRKAASERIITWLLVFLLIAAAAAWLAVDAGYLDIGINLPYDFIKN